MVDIKKTESEELITKKESFLSFFSPTSDVIFKGAGSGLQYGGFGQENLDTVIDMASGNPEVVTAMTVHTTNGLTFQNAKELKVTEPGIYIVLWALSFSMLSGSGQEVEGTIGINDVSQAIGSAHRTIGTGNDTGSMCGTGIVSLVVDDRISLMVENQSSTVDVVIGHASLTTLHVGGVA